MATRRWSVSTRRSLTRRTGVDAFQEQDLALEDVADAGQGALVEQGFGDRHGGAGLQAFDGRVGVEGRVEQVGAELLQGRVEDHGALVHQLDHRRVEAHDDVLGHLQDDARLPGGLAPALAMRVAVPGARHAQVGVQRQAIAEADHQVLAHRLDGDDGGADHALDGRAGRARVRGQHRLPDQQRPQRGGRLEDRVAFRHSALVGARARASAASGPGTRAGSRPAPGRSGRASSGRPRHRRARC